MHADSRGRFKFILSGQSLLEFALVLPVLVLVVFGMFDLGSAVITQNMMANAAREGARTGIILANTDANIRAQVRATAPTLTLTDAQIGIAPSPVRTFNSPISVTVTFTYTPMTPIVGQIVGNGGLQLSANSVMVVEGVNAY
ncbi:MAG: pilus assembly protein [Chloroflexi bacterium]|nr:pilus assembly protein [Chloroflexota bacterium]